MTCGAAGVSNGPLRQKVLPVVYGLATSMSCVLFATGGPKALKPLKAHLDQVPPAMT